jgi:hypothetical protein
MTPVRTFTIASLPVPSAARGDFARVEKISLSNGLHGERDDEATPENFAQAKHARMRTFRNETAQTCSQQEQRRLVPTFVTQVLAQLTESRTPDPTSAFLAYGQSHTQIARVCDRDA